MAPTRAGAMMAEPPTPLDMKSMPDGSKERPGAAKPVVSRRDFLKCLGTSAVATAALGATNLAQGLAEANAERVHGPGAVPVALTINGRKVTLSLEPRVTLLEALRLHAGLTGAKEACDRATCGACTVLVDSVPVYACSMLAIEAQGASIETIEGLAVDGKLTELQQAFVDRDGLQCGYCSPGMVMTLTALLRKNPHPTETEIRRAIAGNVCRCGSYPRIFTAALAASGQPVADKLELVHDHALA